MYLEFKEYILGKYDINLELENNTIYLVFSRNKEYTFRFITSISGINYHSGKCLYNENDIFDNKDYFQKRLLIDFNKKYIKTLNWKIVNDSFSTFSYIKFNSDTFKKSINEVDLRREVLIKDEYNFSDLGIKLCAYCLIKSLNYENLLVLNPYTKGKREVITNVISEITDRSKYNTSIIENNNLSILSQYVDKIIVLTDYNDAKVISRNDSFLICNDNIYLRNKIFREDSIVVSINDYTKEELKNLNKCKLKFKIITFKELIEYLGDKYD